MRLLQDQAATDIGKYIMKVPITTQEETANLPLPRKVYFFSSEEFP